MLAVVLALALAPTAHRDFASVGAVPWPADRDEPDLGAPAPTAAGRGTADAATVAPAADAAAKPSPLVPKREPARMAERPLGPGGKVTFKPAGGLTIATGDKKYALNISLWGQLLYTYAHADPPDTGQAADSQSFQVRRARVMFSGNAFSPHFKYHTHIQVAPRDLGLQNGTIRQSPLFMWWLQYDRLRDLVPQIGMFFVPFSRQRFTQPARLQFVDNSIAAYEFGFDRDIGIDLKSKDLAGLGGRLRYHLGLFMGDGFDYQVQRDFGMQYVARVEVLPFGDFEDVNESDFVRALEPKLAIGGAYSFVDNDGRSKPLFPAPADGGTTDTHNVVADVVIKAAGFSLLADFFWRKGRRNPGNAVMDDGMGGTTPVLVEAARNGMGWTAQAAFLIPRVPFEIGGRYSGIRGLGTTSVLDLDEVGPGISYYFVQHALKLQMDYFHQIGPAAATADRLRVQLTFIF